MIFDASSKFIRRAGESHVKRRRHPHRHHNHCGDQKALAVDLTGRRAVETGHLPAKELRISVLSPHLLAAAVVMMLMRMSPLLFAFDSPALQIRFNDLSQVLFCFVSVSGAR